MLLLNTPIITSDEDQPIVYSLYIGYDATFNLKICLKKFFYEGKKEEETVCAVIDKDNSYLLAKKVNVTMVNLPAYLAKEFDYNITNPSCSKVERIFSDMIDYILNKDIPYSIVSDDKLKM